MTKKGNGFKGSSNILTSIANQQVIPIPVGWSVGQKLSFYKFSFMNYADCHVKINGSSEEIFLRSEQGFESGTEDTEIRSFIISESGIQYIFIGAY